MKTFGKRRLACEETSQKGLQYDPKSAQPQPRLASQQQAELDDIDAETLIEELDEEGLGEKVHSFRPTADNPVKQQRQAAPARQPSGQNDSPLVPSHKQGVSSAAHRATAPARQLALEKAQVKASPSGSRRLQGQAEAAPGDAFEFPNSSPEREASPVKVRAVALPPPRRLQTAAVTESPRRTAAAGAATSGPCLQPSPAAPVSPHMTPTQSQKALLPPRPNAVAEGNHAKEPAVAGAEVDTPTRRLAKRQAIGTGSSPHRGVGNPSQPAANGTTTKAQAPVLQGTPFAGTGAAGTTSRQASPAQGRQAAQRGAAQRGTPDASPRVPGRSQQQPPVAPAVGSGRAQSAPTSRPPSAAAPLLPPGVPGVLRSVTSADAALVPGALAAGSRGAAMASNKGAAGGGSQAAAGTGRVRFGADVILSPPGVPGTRPGTSPAGNSAAKLAPSSTSNGSSSSGRSSGGGGGMALQMSAGQYNQLKRMALQQQGRGTANPVQRAPAQTVMEAQERGELQQLQDTAMYALDGLVPTASRPTQRTSALSLLEILVTRKGRAALRAEGVAQQVLSSLAKLRGCKDPVLALVVAGTLLALACEDAHPSYLASQAACVLMSQLLQVDHDFSDLDALFMPPVPSDGTQQPNPVKQKPSPSINGSGEPAAGKAGTEGERDAYELDDDDDGDGASDGSKDGNKDKSVGVRAQEGRAERATGTGSEDLDPGGIRTSSMPPEARQAVSQLRRALKLTTEGQMGRQWTPQLGPAGTPLRSHLPLLMLALGVATSAEPARVHFAVKVKESIRKVGVLNKIANLVPHYAAHIAAARAQLLKPAAVAATQPAPAAPEHIQPQKQLSGLLQELVLLLKVMENSSFTCVENEEALLQARVPVMPEPVDGSGEQAATAAQSYSQRFSFVERQDISSGSGEESGRERGPGKCRKPDNKSKASEQQQQGPTQSLLACLLQLIRQLSGLLSDCDAVVASTGTASDPWDAGAATVGAGLTAAHSPLSAADAQEVSAGCSACLHSCLAVLMNLSHKHTDAAAVLAGEGGLETVASLLACCAAAQCIKSTGTAEPTQAAGKATAAHAKGKGSSQQQQPAGTSAKKSLLQSNRLHGEGELAQEAADVGTVTIPEAEAHVGCPVVAERGAVLRLMEVLTVGLGLLVNLTSDSPANRAQLRSAVLEVRLSGSDSVSNKGAHADPGGESQSAAVAAGTMPVSAEKRKRAQAHDVGALSQQARDHQPGDEVDEDDDDVPSARPAHKKRRLAANAAKHNSRGSPGGRALHSGGNPGSPNPNLSPLAGKASARGSLAQASGDAPSDTPSSGLRIIPLLCAIISSMMNNGDISLDKGGTGDGGAGAAVAPRGRGEMGPQSQGPAELAGVVTGSPQQAVNLRSMGSGSQQQDLSSWGAPTATRTFTRGGRRGPRTSGTCEGAGQMAGGRSQASQPLSGTVHQSQGEGYRETQGSQSPGVALPLPKEEDATVAPSDPAVAEGGDPTTRAAVKNQQPPSTDDDKNLLKPRYPPSASPEEEEIGKDGVFELTEEQLRDQAVGGEASIVQVYASLLLGFLIKDSEKDRSAAAALLPGGSLLPVLSSIQRMLLFYVQAGAITDSTRDSLVSLLEVLEPAVLGAAPEIKQEKAGTVLEEGSVPIVLES